jgi:conjugal transfer pilus assembly protein TraW
VRRLLASLIGAGALAGAVLIVATQRTEARDYGRLGATFPIAEPDLLATIESRLRAAQASGEMARVNAGFARRVEERVRRPAPVAGIGATEEARSWTFDPTVALERDIRDQKGNLIAAAGQRINPLDFVGLRQDIVFVDGDDPRQLDWATRRYPELKAKIVFVSGSPFEEMTARKRRFFFDQEGKLTNRFRIAHVPAVVSQAGRVLRVSEIVLPQGREG